MSIYTKTGDDGTTGLFGGARVGKDEQVIEVLGNIDELNASIGVVISINTNANVQNVLLPIQNTLFEMGTIIANPTKYLKETFKEENITFLESKIDEYDKLTEPLRNFILPGGSPLVANLHLTRAICRKAERSLVAFKNSNSNKFDNELKYINRLSDLLFVLARYINKSEGETETIWKN